VARLETVRPSCCKRGGGLVVVVVVTGEVGVRPVVVVVLAGSGWSQFNNVVTSSLFAIFSEFVNLPL
jgi:hypothetical protein